MARASSRSWARDHQSGPGRLKTIGHTRHRVKRPHRVCPSGKDCFDSRDEAHTVAERLMDLGKVNRGCHVMPYRCVDCGAWHVGNQVVTFKSDEESNDRNPAGKV